MHVVGMAVAHKPVSVGKKFLSVREAAELLGVDLKTVEKMIASGELQVVRTPGWRRKIPRDSLETCCA